jgi:hypothetical protein
MTLQEALDLALKRVGLLESNTTFETQARVYANVVAKELIQEARWWWAYKTATLRTTRRITVTSPSGTYSAGETVTDGQATAYSATVDSWDSTNSYLYVYSENTVTPTGTLTGGTSRATSTYSSREFTRNYLLATDVGSLYWFVNETDEHLIDIVGPEEYIVRDPARDDTGDARRVIIEGLDADTNTGQVSVAFLPRPSTTNETIRYSYYLNLTDWTSANDTTDLVRWIPPIMQSALVFGIARLYKQEKGDDEGAASEEIMYRKIVDQGLEQNINIWGNRRWRRMETPVALNRFDFRVQEGSLSAAS